MSMDPGAQDGGVPDVRLDVRAPSSFLRQMFGSWLDFSPVKRDESEAILKELAHRQEEAGYQLTAKEARVVANLQTTMSNMGNIFFLVGLVGSALLTRSRPKKNRWVRWPMCFSVALLGQEHANNTAPFAVIGSLASMDSPVGGEVRELARERLPGPAVKLVLSQERPHEPGSPTLRIMMDPAERAHLLAVMQQRSEAARTHRQAPGTPGLPDMSPSNQQRLPRQQGSLWEQAGRRRAADVSPDDAMQDAFSAESDAMFREPLANSRSAPSRPQDRDMGANAGDVFPADGEPWLSGDSDTSQDSDTTLTRRQRRAERRRDRHPPQAGSSGGESLEGYFDDRWENPSSRPR